ncbi:MULTISPECIES: inorganic phosphate transporter [Aestuariimicrobium]|uniref:inorganic phosphate transporter n=1 Tax=Aestuariimicrobium TaxID=396388 RepID=UPI0003B3B3CF|nr:MULTISPECIES: inorganic phosphate transporter [Aestuariimicrobium]
MTEVLIILGAVIVVALAFDFTNGFHDTANAMATSIATGALKPRTAVGLSAVLNLVGAFLSIQVALTVTKDVIKIQDPTGAPLAIDHTVLLGVVLAGLVGGVLWNLITWLLGIPSSSSHALFGGLIGATIAGLGTSAVKWEGILEKVAIPAIAAPLVAGVVAAVGTWLVYRIAAKVPDHTRSRGFRWGQIGSASLVSLAHGTNDAQKTMGVITLALIASGQWTVAQGIPWWVKVLCAVAIAAGTWSGGWRVIRTLGKGLVEIDSPQGMAAETASAAIILSSSHAGMSLSTTHVATGSILGTGVGKSGAVVRWSVAGRMVVAWLITLPAAALVGGLCELLVRLVPGLGGEAAVVVLLVAASLLILRRARRNPIHHDNVNDEWDGGLVPTARPLGGLTGPATQLAGGAPSEAKVLA